MLSGGHSRAFLGGLVVWWIGLPACESSQAAQARTLRCRCVRLLLYNSLLCLALPQASRQHKLKWRKPNTVYTILRATKQRC